MGSELLVNIYLLLTVESPLIDHILYSGAVIMAILAKFCNHAIIREYTPEHGRTGRKKLGGGVEEISPTF